MEKVFNFDLNRYSKDWEKVTIGQHKKIIDLVRSKEEERKGKKLNIGLFLVELLAIIENRTPESYYNDPVLNLYEEEKKIDFISKEIWPDIRSSYEIAGRKFNAELNVEKIQVKNYIDFVQACEDEPENLARQLTAFLVPAGRGYNDGYDFEELEKFLTENCPITYAQGVSFFFRMLLKTRLVSIRTYLERQMKRKKKKMTALEKENLSKVITVLKDVGELC